MSIIYRLHRGGGRTNDQCVRSKLFFNDHLPYNIVQCVNVIMFRSHVSMNKKYKSLYISCNNMMYCVESMFNVFNFISFIYPLYMMKERL